METSSSNPDQNPNRNLGREEQLWEKLSVLCPGLRKHIRIYPQAFRGERWYVLRDESSGQHIRINSTAFSLIGRFDGRLSVQTIFGYLQEQGSTLTRAAAIQLISRLQQLGALHGVVDKATEQLVEEYEQRRRGLRWRRLLSPLMIRIPVLDPDRLLNRMSPYVGGFFKPLALVVWSIVILLGLGMFLANHEEVSQEFRTEVLKPTNLVLLWILYPLLKTLHEFAHAICVKYWGGEVHEMGITFLVLTPVPYVDASAASSFKSKYKRVMVSAAGIAIELFVASIAIALWVVMEDGFLRDCAFGVFTIGAISTVVFNANPLLKFDGYYILQDLIEIPNLYSRSLAYYRYLFKKYVFGLQTAESPQSASGERRWFLFYGLASQIYRVFVMLFIVLFLSSRYLLLGVILGVWAVFQQVVSPACKGLSYLFKSPDLAVNRSQSVARVAAGITVCLAILLFVPVPNTTQAQGVVWVPEQGQLFARAAGFVKQVMVEPGDNVSKGQVLLTLENDDLQRNIVILESQAQVLEINAAVIRQSDPAEFAMLQKDLQTLEQELQQRYAEREFLVVRADADGAFAVPGTVSLIGRHYDQGDLIGHVVDRQQLVIRVAVPEKDSGSMHQGVSSASVRLAESPGNLLQATVQQETPSANNKLPSAALGAQGGGGIAVASSDPDGLTAIDKVFHLQLELYPGATVFGVGERAYVNLQHSAEPLANRWYRAFQQLFLEKLPA